MLSVRSAIAREVRATLPIAVPLAASNLSLMAMGLTNTIIVGHLGGMALSAAGLGGALFFTLSIVCQSVLAAVAPLAASAIGRGDPRAAGQIAMAGLVLAAAIAPPLVGLLSIVDRLLLAIGYDSALAAQIGAFLTAVRWGVPGFLAFGVLRSLLAASRRARTVMFMLLLAIPANAMLCWTLVFGGPGVAPLGIAGSGWSTAAIQSAMSLSLIAVLLVAPRHTPLRTSRMVGRHVAAILRLGLPIGGMVALETSVFATTGILMGLLGGDALGAHQLVINFASLTFMVPLGIGQAATVRVGYELGSGAPAAARRAAFVAIAIGAGFMGAVAVPMWLFPRAIIGVYLNLGDPANRGVIAVALPLLAVAALFQISDGIQTIAAAALRGYRDTAVPMFLAGVGYWGIGFPGGWALAFPLGFGPVGLWCGLALGLAVVASLLTLRLARCSGAVSSATEAGRIVPQT
jgi:MATE family multidrug resistance protein